MTRLVRREIHVRSFPRHGRGLWASISDPKPAAVLRFFVQTVDAIWRAPQQSRLWSVCSGLKSLVVCELFHTQKTG